MKTFTVNRRFSVDVSRDICAETFAEADEKVAKFGLDRFLRMAPGAQLADWERLSGDWISEERE